MRVFIAGGDSRIGSALAGIARKHGDEVILSSRRPGAAWPLDLGCPESWRLPDGPGAAFLCASLCSLAACRMNPEATALVNVKGTLLLAERLAASGFRICFLSSTQVFDGRKPFPLPSDAVSPETEYGRQKAVVEERLLRFFPSSLIVRLSKVVTPDLPLFRAWKEALERKEVIQPFSDSYLSPLSLVDMAEVLYSAMAKGERGILHLSGPDQVSYAEAGNILADVLRVDKTLIREIPTPDTIPMEEHPPHVTLGGIRQSMPPASSTLARVFRSIIWT